MVEVLITVTAPKKGLGQTTTAINIAAMIAKYFKSEGKEDKVILLDINKYCKDIEYYLCDTAATRGLDDFCSLYKSKLINYESFQTCVKSINTHMDIMATNDYFELDKDAAEALIEYSSMAYSFTVLDAIGASNVPSMAEPFYEKSDIIVVVINQIKSVMHLMYERDTYRKYKEKVIFVLNKNIDVTETGTMEYNIKTIKKELQTLEYKNQVFPLDFDVEVINGSNFGSILGLVMGEIKEKRQYTIQLKEIVKYILSNDTVHYALIKDEDGKKDNASDLISKIFHKNK
ncbi:MAG TPA: hypothetical protein DCP90_00230 [Clostridiales bacterium]|nr:MAG: hypothetical protein A2Y22_04430 [Clostridiales bacterium GWD2_32_59]HAN09022.1 hypothetical protein [Clostridiales bacterium]